MNNHLLCTVLSLSLGLAAQNDPNPTNPIHQGDDPYTVSVDFKGGSLVDFADALRAAGKNVNIVVPAAGKKVHIPAMILRNTSVEAALRAASLATEHEAQIGVQASQGTLPTRGPVGEPVYALRVQFLTGDDNNATTKAPASPPPVPKAVRVFSLRGIAKSPGMGEGSSVRLDVKTILTAIDTGLAVADRLDEQRSGEKSEAVLRLHEDSGLLFVAGTPSQLRLVDEILSNLEREVGRVEQTMRRAKAAVTTTTSDQGGAAEPERAATSETSPERKKLR